MARYEIICARCGKTFQADRWDALYCSASCRTLSSRDAKVVRITGEKAVTAIRELLIEFSKPHRRSFAKEWLLQISNEIWDRMEECKNDQ